MPNHEPNVNAESVRADSPSLHAERATLDFG